MYRRIDVLRVVDNQRIVAAHFQRENLFRLAGELAVQLKPCRRAAGKQQPVNIRLGAERFAGFSSALQQVQNPRRQSRLGP